jgi:isopentenyldiphosphate isomerase
MKINNYYKQKQMIARVNKKGDIIGKIEKWEAHRKGVLHKGFTLILKFGEFYVIQHRKHPAFDGVFDLTFSSHQIYIQNKLQSLDETINDALKREWHINKQDILSKPKSLGFVYYRANDPRSEFIEHEVDEILNIKIKNLPLPNHNFAYGYSLVDIKELTNKSGRIYPLLAPWVKRMIDKKMF